MATLTLERVSKIYRQRRRVPVHAVIDVSMAIQDGEIVGLLGSSGCGKTSTLRMIAGFEAVTHGIIAIKGRSIHQLPPAKRNVANVLILLSEFVIDVAEGIAMLIRDRTVIIYDNTVRRAKIARGLNFMNHLSQLLASNAELSANVFGRVLSSVPDDASHAWPLCSRAAQSFMQCAVKFKRRQETARPVSPSATRGGSRITRLAAIPSRWRGAGNCSRGR